MCGWGCGKQAVWQAGGGVSRRWGERAGPGRRKGPDARVASGPFRRAGPGQPMTAWASISTSIGSCGSSTKTVVRHGFTPPGLMFSSMNSA